MAATRHWRQKGEWATTSESARVWIWRNGLQSVEERTKIPNREVRL